MAVRACEALVPPWSVAPRHNDEQLLERLRAGDSRAWRQVLDQYGRLVFSIPLSFGLSREDADDVTQQTFMALMDQVDRIRDGERLGAWLATVSRRLTWKMRRSQVREPTIDDAELLEADPDSPLWTERVADMEWLDQGLARLDTRCRTLLGLLYLSGEDPSYDQVSTELGIPIGSIGPTRARCLEKLRRSLRNLEELATER